MAVRTCWLALLANLLAAVGLHGQDVSLTSLLQEITRIWHGLEPIPCQIPCHLRQSLTAMPTFPDAYQNGAGGLAAPTWVIWPASECRGRP